MCSMHKSQKSQDCYTLNFLLQEVTTLHTLCPGAQGIVYKNNNDKQHDAFFQFLATTYFPPVVSGQ